MNVSEALLDSTIKIEVGDRLYVADKDGGFGRLLSIGTEVEVVSFSECNGNCSEYDKTYCRRTGLANIAIRAREILPNGMLDMSGSYLSCYYEFRKKK